MVNIIEETFDVRFNDVVGLPVLDVFNDFSDCSMAVPVRSVSKAHIIEFGFINHDLYHGYRVLHQFILTTGYPQWSHLVAPILGYIHSSYRV